MRQPGELVTEIWLLLSILYLCSLIVFAKEQVFQTARWSLIKHQIHIWLPHCGQQVDFSNEIDERHFHTYERSQTQRHCREEPISVVQIRDINEMDRDKSEVVFLLESLDDRSQCVVIRVEFNLAWQVKDEVVSFVLKEPLFKFIREPL